MTIQGCLLHEGQYEAAHTTSLIMAFLRDFVALASFYSADPIFLFFSITFGPLWGTRTSDIYSY
jgi:hypothetical protein